MSKTLKESRDEKKLDRVGREHLGENWGLDVVEKGVRKVSY